MTGKNIQHVILKKCKIPVLKDELFKNIFSSGVATGGIAALILNVVLPETHK